jgi:hypothetical protein
MDVDDNNPLDNDRENEENVYEGVQMGGADNEEPTRSRSNSDASEISFIEENEENLPPINIDELANGPYNQGQVIYQGVQSNLSLQIRKIRHRREAEFLEDHLFEISVNEIQRRQRSPLLITLLMIFRTALIQIINDLAQFYDEQNNHQMYVTVIDDSINHGLNTGNYNVRTDPGLVTDRILTMLYNFLTSHMSLRLNQSFRFNIKVLSVRHARERVQRGGFNPHILNGTFKINKKKYLFFLPEGFEDYENVFSQNCLLLSIILGHYLNKYLEIEGKNYLTSYKTLAQINSTKNNLKKEAGLLLLEEAKRVALENDINFFGPHTLDELAPKLTNYFKCQLIIFNNLVGEKIAHMYPTSFDETKSTIYLLQEMTPDGKSHVSLINKIKAFFRLNFTICLYCEKVFKSHSSLRLIHNCKKRTLCESCNRYKANTDTYLNKENFINYCVNGDLSLKCTKCEKTMNNQSCFKYHRCFGFFCLECKMFVKRKVLKTVEETKKLHKCFEKFCNLCKKLTSNAAHSCKLKKTLLDKYHPALGFFNLQIVGNNSECFECYKNRNNLRSKLQLEWHEFLLIDDEDTKHQYLCENHRRKGLNQDCFVNLATLKLETKSRGTFETKIFHDDDMCDLKDLDFKPEFYDYCSLPVYKGKIVKRFGKGIKATNLFESNIENLKSSLNKTPVEKMIVSLLDYENTTIMCFGAEQLLFVFKCFVDHGIECKPLTRGQNILMLEVEFFGLRFLNLKNYFKDSIYDLIDQFELGLEKIYFPEVLNCKENYNLLTLMPSEFPVEFYFNFNDTLIEKENKRKFVEKDKFEEWHFQKKLCEYSLFQTNVLLLASLNFTKNCLDLQGVLSESLFKKGTFLKELTLPFSRGMCTISSFFYNIYKYYFVDPFSNIFVVKNEYPKKIQSSKEEKEFAAYLQFANPHKKYNNVFSSKCDRNFIRAVADVRCYDDDKIYFFNECDVHGHDPNLCPITKKRKKKMFFNKTFDEVRKEFYDKMTYVAENYKHITIEVIWQCEWRFMKLNDIGVINFLKTYIPWPSHHISPREAVRGARIETFMLKWRQQDHLDETMYYLDCSSLYPFMG